MKSALCNNCHRIEKRCYSLSWKTVQKGGSILKRTKLFATAAGVAAVATVLAGCGGAKAAPSFDSAASTQPVKLAAQNQTQGPFTRLSGSNRYATAVAIAKAQYPTDVPSQTAILTSGQDTHLIDALTITPLSYAMKAPILLTPDDRSLGQETAQALVDLNITKAVLVGVDNSDAIKQALQAQGITVAAVYQGSSRYDTAGQIAQGLLAVTGKQSFDTVFLAAGADQNIVDALAAGPIAAQEGAPILIGTPKESPSSTDIYWDAIVPTPEVTYLSQSKRINQVGAMHAIRAYLDEKGNFLNWGKSEDPSYVQYSYSGSDRFKTAWQLDLSLAPHPNTIVIANGSQNHLVDALAAGPYAASLNAPITLVNSSVIPQPTKDYLHTIKAQSTVVAGGAGSVPDDTATAAVQTQLGQPLTPDKGSLADPTAFTWDWSPAYAPNMTKDPQLAQMGMKFIQAYTTAAGWNSIASFTTTGQAPNDPLIFDPKTWIQQASSAWQTVNTPPGIYWHPIAFVMYNDGDLDKVTYNGKEYVKYIADMYFESVDAHGNPQTAWNTVFGQRVARLSEKVGWGEVTPSLYTAHGAILLFDMSGTSPQIVGVYNSYNNLDYIGNSEKMLRFQINGQLSGGRGVVGYAETVPTPTEAGH
ncbi:MAG: cell wall-binding repeat-containing protein [Firmicutes bacterium]|nr:cell wall-binding repeat-containing protein [Bacillota bacterium]